jgi:hypothetical protein
VAGCFWRILRVVALCCCGDAGRFGGCAAGGCHGAHLSGCGENPGAAFDIISDGGEADLQTRLCEPSPAHASKAVASLPRSEDFFRCGHECGGSAGSKPQRRANVSASSRPHMPVAATRRQPPLAWTASRKVFPRYALSANTSPGSSGRA